jgi:hypothetical protein
MLATVAAAAPRLTSLHLVDTRSPLPSYPPETLGLVSVILLRTGTQTHHPVRIHERALGRATTS